MNIIKAFRTRNLLIKTFRTNHKDLRPILDEEALKSIDDILGFSNQGIFILVK